MLILGILALMPGARGSKADNYLKDIVGPLLRQFISGLTPAARRTLPHYGSVAPGALAKHQA